MHKAFLLPVIEFPLAKEVPTASEESCHCQKKREATAMKIALLPKSRRNCQSKSDDSYTKSPLVIVEEMDQQNPTLAKIPILDTEIFEKWQFKIQQYLQHEHYALWEVIEFGDSYEVPASTASTTTTNTSSDATGKKKGRTVTLTAEDMQKRKNDVKARTTLLLGNEATKKTKKNLLKQQYGNFKEKDSETLEQTFNRLQVIVHQLQFMDMEIEQDDLNQKFLTSLAPEWLMHTIVWRNRSDLDTMSLDDLGNEDVNTASVSTTSTNVPTASANIRMARKKISIQGIDMAGFDKSKVECFNCHNMGHFARECWAPRSQDRGRRDNYRQGSKVEEQAPKALMAIDRVGWDWIYMVNDEENHALVADKKAPIEFALMANTSAESKELELIKKEKESLDGKLAGFQTASKDLDSLLESQRLDKNKEGLGYSAVPPPPAQIYSSPKKDLSYLEASPSTILPKSFIKFVKENDSPTKSKIDKAEKAKKYPVKYAEQYKKPTQKPNVRGNQRNWNNLKSHQLGNISYLSDFEPFDGGYVSFGQGGCKITGKGTIKISKLEFENVYFVKDLKTPRQHNMYSTGLNNIVSHKDLTCLVAKASTDECMLWHKRLVVHYQSYQTHVIHQPSPASFQRMNSRVVVPSCLPSYDLIASLNKEMAFSSTTFTSRYTLTNNKLRNSSNLRNQATIQYERVTVQTIQGRQTQGPRNSAWFKEKAMLVEDLESGVVLDEEQMAFLVDNKDIVTTAPSTSDVLMVKFYAYDSDILSEVNKVNKTLNESLTAELERYKEQNKIFEERHKLDSNDREKYIDSQLREVIVDRNAKVTNLQNRIHSLKLQLSATRENHKTLSTTVDVLKKESKAKEDKYLEEIIELEKKKNALDNVVYKIGNIRIGESRLKMHAKQNDPIAIDKKVNIVTNDYATLNKLSENFVKNFVPQKQLSAKQAFWLPISKPVSKTPPVPPNPVLKEIPRELPTIMFEINDLKAQLEAQNNSISKLKDHIATIRGKSMSEGDKFENISKVIAPEMYKLHLEPLSPKLLKNRESHVDYLKHIKKNADTLHEIDEQARALRPLDSDLDSVWQGTNLYTLSLEDMMQSTLICLLSKASKTKSWLWHRRLSYLNFGYINELSNQGLVRGLPKLKYQKYHLCSACSLGKRKKHTYKPKSKISIQEKLYLVHLDLYGPMTIETINGKKYVLVIGYDYSHFTWVKFLRSKDETLYFLNKFLKMIQVRLNLTVCTIRTYNRTEFVNQTLKAYYEDVRISHQTLVPCTPQQNNVIERQNCTLVEAARTMMFNLPKSLVSLVPVAAAPRPADPTGTSSSTSIDQDVPSVSTSPTHKIKSLVIHYGVEERLNEHEPAHFDNDPFLDIHTSELSSQESSSNVQLANPPFEHIVAKIPVLDTGKFEQWQFQIQQYLQHEHYALWEVIEFDDSYVVPVNTTNTTGGDKSGRTLTLTAKDMHKKKNDVKERTTLLISLPDEHQLRFSKYKTTRELWAAILKTFGGNEAAKKTKKNLLKQ
uniref:Retrovirus-related Pol polyprotein from transposon TNT 1-94 n=1 Tax=Tanacetum cinerariifolium TaxID=118510 RepID=A0A6L2JRE3_TANCI|nr:retrovirus-related Pol polyprotein from transposon TNT 1-94 [Tanacetum cinerariifolium]